MGWLDWPCPAGYGSIWRLPSLQRDRGQYLPAQIICTSTQDRSINKEMPSVRLACLFATSTPFLIAPMAAAFCAVRCEADSSRTSWDFGRSRPSHNHRTVLANPPGVDRSSSTRNISIVVVTKLKQSAHVSSIHTDRSQDRSGINSKEGDGRYAFLSAGLASARTKIGYQACSTAGRTMESLLLQSCTRLGNKFRWRCKELCHGILHFNCRDRINIQM